MPSFWMFANVDVVLTVMAINLPQPRNCWANWMDYIGGCVPSG